MPFILASKVHLGIGGDGIIGRRVSLLADDVVVGEGIVGYN